LPTWPAHSDGYARGDVLVRGLGLVLVVGVHQAEGNEDPLPPRGYTPNFLPPVEPVLDLFTKLLM
jgi:hypothetical protein